MLAENSIKKTVGKLEQFVHTLEDRLFVPVMTVDMPLIYQTKEPLSTIPDISLYQKNTLGKWGGEAVYAWFKGSFTVPESLQGKALFMWPKMGFYEATLWLNGVIHSNYAAKFVEGSHGNHYCNRIFESAKAGQTVDVDIECYAYHTVPGHHPLQYTPHPVKDFLYDNGAVDICLRDDRVMDFLFDLKTLLELYYVLPENDFTRAEVENALYEAHLKLLYDPACCEEDEFYAALEKAHQPLKEQLAKANRDSEALVGLIGHSHMDTAWLWPITETEKKCARTYANQLNLMAEYPEYRFVQSSAYHSEMLRKDYPELFARIQQAVKTGRYEPNGGVWVECDCNLTGGEYLLRQFVWGQRFTKKYFDYLSDSFWLPDTFGYSFAIPQIMKGCGIKYFLTTKMSWNDTNKFPYTTFYWQGLDGTRVLTHLNRTHVGPSPKTLHDMTDGDDGIKEKRVSPMRLFSFGKGDGGGGPEFEMIEMARRVRSLKGVPRSEYMTVSEFMNTLEKTAHRPSVYADEMYLELHRGTLTNQHEIKRGNRKLEIALHTLELAEVRRAIMEDRAADEKEIAPLMNTLLVHQFHDILPGTCIHTALEETRQSVGQAIKDANQMICAEIGADGQDGSLSLMNSLSFENDHVFYIETKAHGVQGCTTQTFTDLDGRQMLAVSGVTLPAFGIKNIDLTDRKCTKKSPFTVSGNAIDTPYAKITLDENGFIASMIDKRTDRELVSGLPFNTLLTAEDVSNTWDNWDVDADLEEKFSPTAKLLSKEIVADGPVELRMRLTWQITANSTVAQDMIFDAASPMISFDTRISWQDGHRFLKTAFDTSLHADGVRNEIQFGHIRRSNHRSNDWEKAHFEICNHKYSDLSENSYGITLINDCKYGLSANEGSMRLSLHKGGLLPDPAGDKGVHTVRYAILPHCGGFSAETAVQPAYAFNYEPVVTVGHAEQTTLAAVDQSNVIIETVKPCEDAQKAYILRLYEAAGDYTRVKLDIAHKVKGAKVCDMLENEQSDADLNSLVFKPFEIKTIKIMY